MIQGTDSSSHKEMLCRYRLCRLIEEGLQHPLLEILAGPGYGKTQSMAGYLAESKAAALWQRLTRLDNICEHFWNNIVKLFQNKYPDLSQNLCSLGFPDSLSSFELFIQLLNKYNFGSKRLIVVFDDFGLIENETIKAFFRMLVEMELDKISLVLISGDLASTKPIAFSSSKRFLVLAKDLRFTANEIEELYNMYKMHLDPDELHQIEQCTEGWPMALGLLAQNKNKAIGSRLLDEIAISQIFEERFFSTYSGQEKHMLVKLSLLNYFTRELAAALYEGDPLELDEERLANHPFMTKEPETGRIYLHFLYRIFLQRKQKMITEGDVLRVWKKAGDFYAANGDALEAISLYRKGNYRLSMLKVISDYARNNHDITKADGEFFQEHLDLLTPEEVREHPEVDFLRADIYFSASMFEKAEALLTDLGKRLQSRKRADESELLGEVYVALGLIYMVRNQEHYGGYFEKAAAYLPEGSKYYNKSGKAAIAATFISFAMPDNLPGAKERMEQAARSAAPWIYKVLPGCMNGMEHIISAESAYMSYDLARAQQESYLSIYKAEAFDQHYIACNAYFILARIGWLRGDYPEMVKNLQKTIEYADSYKIAAINEIRDMAVAWCYISLRDDKRLPNNITSMDYSKKHTLTNGRSQIIYARHLIVKGEYAKLVGMLENPKGLFLSGGLWFDRMYLYPMLSVGYHYIENQAESMKCLWTAYNMCLNNGQITCFIEGGEHMIAVVHSASRQQKYNFDKKWLDLIFQKSSNYANQSKAMRHEYHLNQNSVESGNSNPLSKREREVLQALSLGLTREEIAHKQYISVNTVKSVIRSIYNKLDSNNRAGAVALAIAHGYIKGHKPQLG